MSKLIGWIKREPVRAFMAAQGLVAWAVTGLIVFDAWSPTVEQLTFVTSSVTTIASAFGFTLVRNVVTPEATAQARIAAAIQTAGRIGGLGQGMPGRFTRPA